MKLVALIASIVSLLVVFPVDAQTYPSKSIRFIVPFAPGGSGDIVGRTIGAKLTDAWGQQILIDNRPGAAGAIGASAVARSAGDGYTLLLADDSPLAITPHIHKSLPYNPIKDFAPIVPIAHIEFLMTVHPSVPASTLPELVALLKANPEKYSYASSGIGSIHHLSMEWLKRLAGVKMVHVPYKGSGQILPDVIAGLVPITYTGLAQTWPYVQSGKLKPVAIGGPRRVPSAPGVAPVAETYAGFNGTASWNLLAPADTPRDIVQKLNDAVNRILRDPQVAQQLESRGLFPLGGSSEEFARRLKADYEKWGKIVAEIGLKAE